MAVLFVKDAKTRDFHTKILGFTEIVNNGDANFVFKEGFAILQVQQDKIIPKTIGKDICKT